MKPFFITVEIKEISGTQVWRVEAKDPADALKRLRDGEGEILHEEIDVQSTNINSIGEESVSENE
jgi:hypothetical protein